LCLIIYIYIYIYFFFFFSHFKLEREDSNSGCLYWKYYEMPFDVQVIGFWVLLFTSSLMLLCFGICFFWRLDSSWCIVALDDLARESGVESLSTFLCVSTFEQTNRVVFFLLPLFFFYVFLHLYAVAKYEKWNREHVRSYEVEDS
jgi:hypothetical protein